MENSASKARDDAQTIDFSATLTKRLLENDQNGDQQAEILVPKKKLWGKVILITIFFVFLALIVALSISIVKMKQEASLNMKVECLPPGVKLPQKGTTLNIYLIPHSHMDAGYQFTIDVYYHSRVKIIYEGIVKSLMQNPARTFVISEMGFFQRWWNEQSTQTKNQVQFLVKNGQIDFAGGGLINPDEATTYYEEIIDQATLGHKFLKETFQITPKLAWDIDSFGHSTEYLYLLGKMGYHSNFISRIPVMEETYRKSKNLLQFMWYYKLPDQSKQKIFFQNFGGYATPEEFCYSCFYRNFSWVESDNIRFANYLKTFSAGYHYKDIFVLMGDDFAYTDASKFYDAMDHFIDFFKIHRELQMNVNYLLPSKYVAMMRANIIEEKVVSCRENDMYPYSQAQYSRVNI